MNDVQKMAAMAAIQDMLKRGYVSICTVKKILEITGGIPEREDLQILELLHCVSFVDMPIELRRGLPLLLQRVLGSEAMEFALSETKEFKLSLLR